MAIRVKNLFRQFGPKEVLKDISFEISPGESVALIGRNGSGKTTLLRILATLSQPSHGEAWVGGYSVAQDPRKIRSLIGWIPASDTGFVPRFNGLENLHFFGSLYGLRKKEIQASIDQWKGMATLDTALHTPFYLCSAGMKQTLLIVRALLPNPSILLLDEPARSLDPESLHQLRTTLSGAFAGKTLIFSSHSEENSPLPLQRTLKLNDGRLM